MKKIWFVYPYGNIPGESSIDMRYIRFGRALSEKYECVWWTANFSNVSKKYRSAGRKSVYVAANLKVELIPTSAYKKNISVGRVMFETNFARNLYKAWLTEEKPDLIISPGTGLMTAFRPIWPYMKRNQVLTIYDIMDIHLINEFMREHYPVIYPFIRLVSAFNNFREKGFYKNVVGVTGLGRKQLEIAKKRTGNSRIPSCLIYNSIDINEFRSKMQCKCSLNLPAKEPGWVWCVYAGSLGPSYDIPSILKCAEMCKKNDNKILFIIAGSGQYADACASCENDRVVFLGKLDKDDLYSLYGKCDVGLSTYEGFSTVDMPDKFYDYTAAGLAIVNSLKGESKDHVKQRKLGIQYHGGDFENLYKAICRFEDEKYLQRCKVNSYRIAEEFDLGKQLKGLCDFVDNILDA